jgi:hypothetical protein
MKKFERRPKSGRKLRLSIQLPSFHPYELFLEAEEYISSISCLTLTLTLNEYKYTLLI